MEGSMVRERECVCNLKVIFFGGDFNCNNI